MKIIFSFYPDHRQHMLLKQKFDCCISILPNEDNEIRTHRIICRRCNILDDRPLAIHLPYFDNWINFNDSKIIRTYRKWFTSMDSEIIEDSFGILIERRDKETDGEWCLN